METHFSRDVAFALCNDGGGDAGESPEKHRDIENKIEQFVSAWNNHDCDSMADKWEKDGDIIDPAGREARGRVEITKLFDDKFHGPLHDTHLTMSIESVKMLDDHVAVVDGTAHITRDRTRDDAEPMRREHHVTLVMHEDWGWHFSSVRAYFYEEHPMHAGRIIMENGPTHVITEGPATVGLLVRLEAKPGREKDVEDFLASGLPLAQQEPATTAWFSIRVSPTEFAIFDVFPDDTGRQAHLSGKIAAALMDRAPELFAKPPVIEKVDVVAAKLP